VVIPKGFPGSVGRVESRPLGFPCFPYSVISMACFGNAFHKVTITAKAHLGNRNHLSEMATIWQRASHLSMSELAMMHLSRYSITQLRIADDSPTIPLPDARSVILKFVKGQRNDLLFSEPMNLLMDS
jgi:hypothetical protein